MSLNNNNTGDKFILVICHSLVSRLSHAGQTGKSVVPSFLAETLSQRPFGRIRSMLDNPYAVGDYAEAGGHDPNEDPMKNEIIRLLVETRPWVRLVGILLMIAAVLMILGAVTLIVVTGIGGGGGVELGIFGLLYFVLAILYVYPALCLNRYASAISAAETERDLSHVVEAIQQQKKFWRFVGICAAMLLVIYVLVAVVGVIGAVL